jgi:hypothetical protein
MIQRDLLLLLGLLALFGVESVKGTRKLTNVWKRSSATLLISSSLGGQVLAAPLRSDLAQDPIVRAEAEAMKDNTNTRAKLVNGMNELLTNPVLENLRLNTQASVDVTANSKDVNVNIFLVPIMKLNEELELCKKDIQLAQKSVSKEDSLRSIKSAKATLSDYNTPSLKKLFNRYSDNIFYSDKREANLYLNGGATPGSAQTTAYLFRNSIITGINNVGEDLAQLIEDPQLLQPESKDREQFFLDTLDDLKEAQDAFRNYLNLISPDEKMTAANFVNKN